MANMFIAFLLTSALGSALYVLLRLLGGITRKIFSAGWHYYMWLVVLLVMILPFQLPETKAVTAPAQEVVYTMVPAEVSDGISLAENKSGEWHIINDIAISLKSFVKGNGNFFAYIWFFGAIVIFLSKLISYIVFIRKMKKQSEIIPCPEVNMHRNITTRISDSVCSPLVIGVFKPTLLLPKTEMTPTQFKNVLAHEMTHLKRNDILYKWLACLTKCVHWFNPVVYFISRQINIDCESSCDLSVIKDMSESEKNGYIETILALLSQNNKKAVPLTTGMTGNKKSLRKRFLMIKNKAEVSRKTASISVILAIAVFLGAITVSGVLNGRILKIAESIPVDENEPVYLNTDKVIEEIPDLNIARKKTVSKAEGSEEKVISVVEKEEVKKNVPSAQEIKSEKEAEIRKSEGEYHINEVQSEKEENAGIKIKSTEVSDEEYMGFERLEIEDMTSEKLQKELSEKGIYKSETGSADLSQEYVVGAYSYEDSLSYNNEGIKCDENGNISIYIATNSDSHVSVQFSDTETSEDVGGYGILANNQNAYTFTGFDSDKTYDVAIKGDTGDTWKIEGEYIIY